MKKLTSLLLALCLIIGTFNMCALADGYGDSFGSVEDTLPDIIERDFDPDYAVAYNDFESVSASTFNSGFVIEDTGNSAYGKALKVPESGWAVPGSGIYNATYTWNNTTYKVFDEAIEEGEDYIFSYEYWSDPEPSAPTTSNLGGAFTFAPQHDQFWNGDTDGEEGAVWAGNDHRNVAAYYDDGKWHLDTVAFTAKATTHKYVSGSNEYTVTAKPNNIYLKVNTGGTHVQSYIDNYLIMKAGAIIIDDVSGSVSLETISGDFMLANDTKSYNNKTTVALGSDIKFKLNSSNIGIYVSEVKMGNETLTPDADGVYSVKITDDINVSVATNTNLVTDEYYVDSKGYIYFEDKLTTNNFTDSLGAPNSLINVTRGEANAAKDIWLTANDKLSYSVGDVSYTVKYIGDVANGGDGKWTVSDVVSTISNILEKEETDLDTIAFDINKSNTVTVSDVVSLRNKILNLEEIESADSEVVAEMDAFIQDVLTRSGTEATEQDLINGIYNYGDRVKIANVIRKAMRGETVKIVYFGGSITNTSGGSSAAPFTNQITETGGYVEWITRWFKAHFGENSIDAFNAGIGSTDTPLAIHRMVEDVLEKEPDIVINEWSMNDNADIYYKQGTYEAVVKRLLENDIAVLLYGFAGATGYSAERVHKPIADYYNVPFISENMAFGHLENFSNLTNDTVHPNMVGHALTGINMAYFLQDVYENIDAIGEVEVALPAVNFHPEAHYYEGAYMADLYDIYQAGDTGYETPNGAIIKITDMGSFKFDATKTSYGIGNFRSYYGATATLADSYEPMVIEISSCKTLFVLRKIFSGITDGAFYLEVNGEKLTNSEYNCSKGKTQDTNPEAGYHWPTPLVLYDPEYTSVELKIYPNMLDNDANNKVTFFSLLLS